jgi:methylmalonyl-CoA mutase cobalamin-binding subunit
MSKPVNFRRKDVLPEPELPDFSEITSQARKMAKTWTLQQCEFLKANQCSSEADYKRSMMSQGRVMQHAHMGFRSKEKSLRAFAEIYERTTDEDVTVDRVGICLDWSMGFPRSIRDKQLQGTGLILDEPEDFSRLTNSAPVASHFGDFMLGFPAALDNTCNALSAGVTTIGNLGQYFTFNLPDWKDDIATTESTLTAISLMTAQPEEVVVHSNLDDGFAAVFEDIASALGAALVERYLVEDLMQGRVAHCYGHHYSTPLLRYGFQQALAEASPQPGSMVFGNTTSYRGSAAQNYASLAGYLRVDIAAQKANPTGHAVNPVPVTENTRIPDIEEIIDAQLFAARLGQIEEGLECPVDPDESARLADTLLAGAWKFRNNLLAGFTESGIDTANPVEMFLAIRRIGGKKLERWYGPGKWDKQSGRRIPLVRSDTSREIEETVSVSIRGLGDYGADDLAGNDLALVVASTDVHQHSKMILESVFAGLGIRIIDGGVSADPDDLANIVEAACADVVALTTYNGVALSYFGRLRDELAERGLSPPVLIGGQLNEIPEQSDSSLPVDVTLQLEQHGAIVCRTISDAMPVLIELSRNKAAARANQERSK